MLKPTGQGALSRRKNTQSLLVIVLGDRDVPTLPIGQHGDITGNDPGYTTDIGTLATACKLGKKHNQCAQSPNHPDEDMGLSLAATNRANGRVKQIERECGRGDAYYFFIGHFQ